jgi:hypothetical protein
LAPTDAKKFIMDLRESIAGNKKFDQTLVVPKADNRNMAALLEKWTNVTPKFIKTARTSRIPLAQVLPMKESLKRFFDKYTSKL